MKPSAIVVVAIAVLLAACSPNKSGDAKVDPRVITEAISSTMGKWKDGRLGSEEWPEAIRALKPLRVYSDRMNAVIALSHEGGFETGIYVYVQISSYIPRNGEGWVFDAIGEDVWHYTRADLALKVP